MTTAIALLADLIGPSAAANTDALEELAKQLGDLPLALTQAGAYIVRTPRTTLATYLQLLKDTPDRMHAAATAGGDAERVVAKVLTLSHARIHTINPLAGHVLNLLACFAPDHLPCAVLDRLPDADQQQIDEALALLASYSLITLTTDPGGHRTYEPQDLISVHRLIQATTLAQLTDEQRAVARDQAADLLQSALPDDPEQLANWPAYQVLLPHARKVLPPDSPGLEHLITYLRATGDYTTALNLQHQVHTYALAALGAEHPKTLATRHDLAYIEGEAGDATTARDQLAALLPIKERILGADHPSTLITRHELARWTGRMGDATAARDHYAALLSLDEHILGADHPDTLTTRHQLIYWMGEAGDAAAAVRDQFAALLPVRERVLGAEHPETLVTRNNLAYWTGKAGDAAAARDQFAVLLSIRERVLGAVTLTP
ncbi:tetratricopeptide repeat protein [Nonomuraea aurantiaca]|uniref:tetratricopeptide repeat protein n=1 Tax=Nonomuraea aurantiaca TaxID=2878562 RepID=UPI001CD970E5|nr:tetratricopeptide repeat protein [Nonomuraea aurantiaca]MCA2229307.1 tetratricopeptide repeat protein [Nonomuraea aurantiaca]